MTGAIQLTEDDQYLNAHQQIWWDFYQSAQAPEDEASRDAALEVLRGNDVLKDYEEFLLRNAVSHQHNFSMRGGSDAYRYYFSTTYNDIESPEVGDESSRVNLLMNNTFGLSKKFEASLGVNIVFDNAKFNAEGIAMLGRSRPGFTEPSLARFDALYNEDGTLANIPRSYSNSFRDRTVASDQGFLNWDYSPISEIKNKDYTSEGANYRINLGLKYDVLDWVSAEIKGQYEIGSTERRDYRNESAFLTRHEINRFITLDDDGFPVYQFPRGGVLDLNRSNMYNYTARTQINLDKRIDLVHQVTATVGAEIREVETNRDVRQLIGYNDVSKFQNVNVNWRELLNMDRSMTSIVLPGGRSGTPVHTNPAMISFTKTRNLSTFANLVYTYNDKYSLNLNVKRDQSNIFGVSARLRANPLWSIGGNWDVKKEEFFNADWAGRLNVRASYGVSGNLTPLARAIPIVATRQLRFLPSGVSSIGRPGNPNLTHEKTAAVNIAVDAQLFNRINATVEYYNKRSTDLLIPAEINPTYGFSTLTINEGELSNKGITVQLSGDVVRSGDFAWNTNFNFTYNVNEVVKYNFQGDSVAFDFIRDGGSPGGYFEGLPLGVQAVYRWAGLTSDTIPGNGVNDGGGGSQIYNAEGEIVRFDDPNFGFRGITDINALAYTRSFQAPYFGGWTNSVSWKGLTLSALIVYKMGHVFRKPTNVFPQSGSARLHQSIADRWKEEGDEASTDIPTAEHASGRNGRNLIPYFDDADIQIADASFIRLRDVTLRYDLSRKIIGNKLPFTGISLTAQARNLGMLWKANDDNIDPEYIPFTGGALSVSGSPFVLSRQKTGPDRQFVLGIEVNF